MIFQSISLKRGSRTHPLISEKCRLGWKRASRLLVLLLGGPKRGSRALGLSAAVLISTSRAHPLIS